MYCSLDDAWNINNNISNIAKNYETKNETIEKTYNLKKKKLIVKLIATLMRY